MSLLRAEKRVRLRLPVMLRIGLSRRKGTRKIIQIAPSLRSLTDALLPAAQGTLRQSYIARRKKWFSFFKESPFISFANLVLFNFQACCIEPIDLTTTNKQVDCSGGQSTPAGREA
ncbi:hypothetical protein D8M06_18420 [Oceanobacillus halophilus]|uniref:Uncharacterized protein n=1 Tax=Oceanobacillus halophilus TaxID=930130 RepID=A0A494ZW41_9BACI|nr:hypothetical protein D8M06_18420 [Oceanobacillus halophilus]